VLFLNVLRPNFVCHVSHPSHPLVQGANNKRYTIQSILPRCDSVVPYVSKACGPSFSKSSSPKMSPRTAEAWRCRKYVCFPSHLLGSLTRQRLIAEGWILKPGNVRSVRTDGSETLGFCLAYWTTAYRLHNLYQKLGKANLERQ